MKMINQYDSFPTHCGIEEIMDFYGNVTNQEVIFDNVPKHISLRNSKKENITIISDNNSFLNTIIKIFPLAYYKLIGWITPNKIKTYSSTHKEQLLKCTDKILVVCNSDPFINLSGYLNKIINFEKINLEKVGESYLFNFGNKNPDKTFIVWVPSLFNGLMWHMKRFIRSSNGMDNYYCFADMQNFPNQHIAPMDIGSYNAWDIYFKPLSKYTPDEIYQSSKVILTDKSASVPDVSVTREILSDYIGAMENEYSKLLFHNKENCFSVFLRGTDYVRFPWHNIPFDPYEASIIAEEYMKHYGFEYIFLNTEDQHNYQVFSDKFGDKLIALKRKRFIKGAEMPTVRHIAHGFESNETGRDYLLETLLTSRTKGTLAGPGASITPLKDFGKGFNLFFDNILFKNAEGSCGKHPILIESHNKNHFDPKKFHEIENPLKISISTDVITIKGETSSDETIRIFENTPIDLQKSVRYCVSFGNTKNLSKIEFAFSFQSDTGKIYTKTTKDILQFPEDIQYVSISIKVKKGPIDSSFSIQIEEGIFPTNYEPYRYSETDFAIKDSEGLLHKFDYLNSIDFKRGTMDIGGTIKEINLKELERANNIIKYPRGFVILKYMGQLIKNPHSINNIVIKNKIDSIDEYLSSIPYGSMQSHTIRQLARSYLNSEIPELAEVAIDTLEKYMSHPEIKYELAYAFWKGTGVEKNLDKSREYFKEIIQKHSGNWIIYEYCELLKEINTQEALNERIEYLENSTISKEKRAVLQLARSYKEGLGVDPDYYKTVNLLKKAIDLGEISAINELLGVYWNENTEESLRELLTLARNYSSTSNLSCILYLGRMYLNGKGVNKDKKQAAYWFEKIQTDSNWARNLLLDALWDSDEDSKNKFIKYVQKYSDQGLTNAQYYMGYAYMKGYGFEKNLEQSKKWLSIASQNGNMNAKRLLLSFEGGKTQ